MKKIAAFILFIGVLDSISAQSTLTLDSCRALALSNNKELRISAEKITAAHYEKKTAFTNYLPKIAAIGTYMHTQKEISLLSDEQKGAISQIGTTAQGSIQETFQQLAASNPELAQILQPLAPLIPGIGNALNKVGQGLVDALRTDTRNMYAGAVTLTQPIFMGGKIVAYNKITKYAEQLAESQHATGMQDIILSTDQAYWQVISLINKKKLAQSYLQLVSQLDSDVDKMITEGVATKADGLSVKVKVNEAEMKLTQIDNGLSLSKMVLCQLCGLPLNDEIRLADEDVESLTLLEYHVGDNVATALANREELRSLDLANKIYDQKVNITARDFFLQ